MFSIKITDIDSFSGHCIITGIATACMYDGELISDNLKIKVAPIIYELKDEFTILELVEGTLTAADIGKTFSSI